MEWARTCAVMTVSMLSCSSPEGAAVREQLPKKPLLPTPIQVFYDNAKLSVALPDGTDDMPLHTLLSGKFAERGQWQELRASGGQASLTALRPSETYKEHTFRLFRDKSGSTGLGLFRDLDNVPVALQPKLKAPVMQLVSVDQISSVPRSHQRRPRRSKPRSNSQWPAKNL